MKFEGNWAELWQNVWKNIEKSSKIGQDKESLISTAACFYYCQSLISWGETEQWAISPP